MISLTHVAKNSHDIEERIKELVFHVSQWDGVVANSKKNSKVNISEDKVFLTQETIPQTERAKLSWVWVNLANTSDSLAEIWTY